MQRASRRRALRWGALVVSGALLSDLSGCGGGSSGSSVAPVIESVITTNPNGAPSNGTNTYQTGQVIQVTVTFRNISGVTQTLFSPRSSFLRVAIAPENDDDPVAYVTKAAQETPSTITLTPNQTYAESGTYNQTRNIGSGSGQVVPRGRYVLKSELLGNPRNKTRDLETTITLVQ